MSAVRSFATVAAILAFAAVSAFAQPIISAKSGVIAGVEGKVLVDNEEVQQSVTHFPEVKENSILRTEEGRVELMLPPGFMLRMGENGSLKMLANRLIDTRVELQTGSAVVEVDQTNQDYNVTIALKNGVVTLSKVGVYRFDCEPARLKVFHGTASVQIGGENVIVATAKMLSLAGDSATVEKFDVEATDALDNWSRRRAEAMALANVSGAKYSGDNSAPARSGSGGTWSYNPYFDIYTYIPYYGRMCNPYYGICYYSPMAAYQSFWMQPVAPSAVRGFGGGSAPGGYTPLSGTSTGTATSISSAPAMSASSPAMSSGSSTSAAASSASSGHGSAASGGHGK
jgi:hypothetical protein